MHWLLGAVLLFVMTFGDGLTDPRPRPIGEPQIFRVQTQGDGLIDPRP